MELTSIESKTLQNGTKQLAMKTIAGWNHFYPQVVEIKESEICASEVFVYEINSNWKRHTRRIESWLLAEKASGCGLW